MTLCEAMDMIDRGETPEEYKMRNARIRRLSNERDSLSDMIDTLKGDTESRHASKREKAEKRLVKVLKMIDELK